MDLNLNPPGAAVLLVLLGSVLVAAGETGDLQREATRTAASSSSTTSQQTCQSDIHTVLREMSVLIAEQRVELRYTKTQMEALVTRLRASENKAETLVTRLRASEKTVENEEVELRNMKTQMEALTELHKENEALKVSLNDLRKKQEEQAAALSAVGGSVNLTGSQVEELRREREESRVSFSASLVESGHQNIGPFHAATPLVYRHVFTNIGNAYNPDTGVFTAPVKGVYHFVLFVYGLGHGSRGTGVSLHKNGEHVTVAWCRQPNETVTPSTGATLQLEKGDVVYVKLWPHSWVRGTPVHPNTFSGHLLFKL